MLRPLPIRSSRGLDSLLLAAAVILLALNACAQQPHATQPPSQEAAPLDASTTVVAVPMAASPTLSIHPSKPVPTPASPCPVLPIPRGSIVFSSPHHGVYTIDLGCDEPAGECAGPVNTVLETDTYLAGTSWSPDGTKIIFASSTLSGGAIPENSPIVATEYRIVTMSRDGTALQTISRGTDYLFSPQWCPASDRIIYASSVGDYRIYVVNQKGQGFSFKHKGFMTHAPNCAPNSSSIAFQANNPATGQDDLYVMDLDRNASTPIAAAVDSQVAWSPDGKYLAYSPELRGSGGGVCIADLEAAIQNSPARPMPCPIPGTEGLVGPRWSPDGQWLLATLPGDPNDPSGIYLLGVPSILAMTSSDAPLAPIFIVDAKTRSTPIWLSDSRHVAFIERDHVPHPWSLQVLDIVAHCPATSIEVVPGSWDLSWTPAS